MGFGGKMEKKRKNKKRIRAYLFLLAGLSLLPGCGTQPDKHAKKEAEQSGIILVDSSGKEKEGACYKTIAGAFAYVNAHPPKNEKERITIQVAKGTYRECTNLTAPYVTLTGEGEKTVLTYYYGSGNKYASKSEEVAINSSASTHIAESAHDFTAQNITFENSYNLYVTEEEKEDYDSQNEITLELREKEPWENKYQTQAVALEIAADRSVLRNCRIIGRQDTLFVNGQARIYFKDCFIEGTADFICGDATCVFEQCTLNCPYNSGYVTACACSKNNPYGYLFKDCTISCEPLKGLDRPKEGDYALGRPWRNLPQVIFWDCKMDTHIAVGRNRFIGMVKEYPVSQCRFIEYGTMDSKGNKLDLQQIASPHELLLGEEELQNKYSPQKHFEAKFNNETQKLEKADHWKPF